MASRMEVDMMEKRHGIKRVKLEAPALWKRRLEEDLELDHKHSKAMSKKWLECPLDTKMKAALQMDLEELDGTDSEDSAHEFEADWVDEDDNLFGTLPLKNPYDRVEVQEINCSLPYASIVKASMVSPEEEHCFDELQSGNPASCYSQAETLCNMTL